MEEEMDFVRYVISRARRTSTVTFRTVSELIRRENDGYPRHSGRGGIIDDPESQMQTGRPA